MVNAFGFHGCQSTNFSWGVGVSTGSGSDRVTMLAISILEYAATRSLPLPVLTSFSKVGTLTPHAHLEHNRMGSTLVSNHEESFAPRMQQHLQSHAAMSVGFAGGENCYVKISCGKSLVFALAYKDDGISVRFENLGEFRVIIVDQSFYRMRRGQIEREIVGPISCLC